MSQPDYNDEGREDPPLDPATQRIQMKLRRLLLGSSLIMFIGFIAVFAAIFYKINSSNDDRVVEFPTEIDLGRGGQVIQFGADSGVLFFVVTGPLGGEVLARVDAETGVILSRTSLGQ